MRSAMNLLMRLVEAIFIYIATCLFVYTPRFMTMTFYAPEPFNGYVRVKFFNFFGKPIGARYQKIAHPSA